MSYSVILADFIAGLSAVNLQIQGKSIPITELISAIIAFRMQILALISDFEEERFEFFTNITYHLQNDPDSNWKLRYKLHK